MTEERWLPVPGYEGFYEVSDLGRVRSLPRVKTKWRGDKPFTCNLPGIMLKPGSTPSRPYLTVALCRQTFLVHRVVAAAFLGPRPSGMPHIRHLNGDGKDNRLVNLRYGTVSENQKDRLRHGNDPHANRTHCPQGHEYSPENLRADKRGSRQCRPCHRASEARRRARKRRAAADARVTDRLDAAGFAKNTFEQHRKT